MMYVNTDKFKEGSALVMLANETTATGYLYAMPESIAKMLTETDEAVLGKLMPSQAVETLDDEAMEIADTVCEIARTNGIDGEIWCEHVPIETKWFESGWAATGAQEPQPPRLDVLGIVVSKDTTENDLARLYTDRLPESYHIWGFGKDDDCNLWCIVVDGPEDEEADEDKGRFFAYKYVGYGTFENKLVENGYDAFKRKTDEIYGIAWNPDVDLVIDYARRIAEEAAAK